MSKQPPKDKQTPKMSDLISSLGRSSTDKPGSNHPKTPPIPTNYKILGVVFTLIVVLGAYIFYLNPFRILDYIRIPVIIVYVILLFCVLIFIERYTKDPNVIDKNSFTDMQARFIVFLKSYFIFIGVFLIFAIMSYYIYGYVKSGGSMLINASLPISLGLIILILALFSNYSKNHTIDHPVLDLIKDIIMYIPCLLTDAIDFIKKDYQNTPSSVFIVFIILLVYITTFYISPMIKKEMYKKDGILLVENPVYLNKSTLGMTTSELRDKVFESMPFYDRWIQTMMVYLYDKNGTLVFEQEETPAADISSNFVAINTKINNNFIVPPDRKSYILYEGFTTLANEDIIPVIESINFLNQTQKQILSIVSSNDPSVTETIKSLKNTPDMLKEYIRSVVKNEPYLLSFVEKVGILYAAGLSAKDAALMTISDKFRPMQTETHVYRYSMSLWVYLNKIEKTNNKQTILSYGSLPSLYYDSTNSTLSLEYKDYSDISGNNLAKNKVLYKTKHVLYQRWNHIVITYNYGTVDLFINNNLVGNYKNVSPYINDNDLLIIGSKDNKNLGGICNVKYYPNPLTASKVKSIYTQFNNKEPPI